MVSHVVGQASEFAGVPSSVDDVLAVEGEARRRANAMVDSLAR